MPRHPFTLEQIRTFVAVADAGSMTRAGQALFLTQGAVTQQVRNFERALGLQLLGRSAAGVHLTSAGAEVAESCREALAAVDRVKEVAVGLATLDSGSIRLGASPAAAGYYLPPLLERFRQWDSGVSISVATENTARVAARVVAGSLDCAMIDGPLDERGLLSAEIAIDRLVLVARADSPLARLRHPDVAALNGQCYLAREPGASVEHYAKQMLGAAHGRSRRIEFGSLGAVRGAVRAGLGYCLLPEVAIRDDLERGSLVVLPWEPVTRSIRAVRRPALGTNALEEFWRLVAAAATDPATAGDTAKAG